MFNGYQPIPTLIFFQNTPQSKYGLKSYFIDICRLNFSIVLLAVIIGDLSTSINRKKLDRLHLFHLKV